MQHRIDSTRMTLALQQANRILKGLTDCQIEFVSDDRLMSAEWGTPQLNLLRTNIETSKIIESTTGGRFAVAVRDQNGFAGLAVISGWQGKPDARLSDLAGLLTTVIERALNEEDGDEVEISVESQAFEVEIPSFDFSESNIVEMHPGAELDAEFDSRLENVQKIIEALEADERMSDLQSKMNPLPLLIESRGTIDAHKIAVEIHELSGRWAMLSLESLSSDILKSREALKELGGITLFIPDICALTSEQQADLAAYLSTQPSREMPQVVAATRLAIDPQLEQAIVLPRLLKMFCVSRVPWAQVSSENRMSNADIAKGTLKQIYEGSHNEMQETASMKTEWTGDSSSRVIPMRAKRANQLLH